MIRLSFVVRGYPITDVQINSAISTRELAKNLRRVKSSNIYAIAYDATSKTMLVRFHRNGVPTATYIYYDVPIQTYRQFFTKPSVGKHFWETVRNNTRIHYQKLRGNL